MKHNKISILTLCLSAFSLAATTQNVTVLKQGGVGHVYEIEQVDSVVYFPIGDEEQFPASEAENTTTLWDIIKAQPNLKKFAAILEAADYYTGKGKAPTGLNFSQLLSGSVPLSVYAPTDAAISEDKYAELMTLAKTDGWKLQQEFLFNHISPQERNEADNDAVQMLNSKIVGLTSYGITAIDQKCNNGKLFTMPSVFPYLPNLEEYLLGLAPDCTLAREFMVNYCATGTAFDARNSIFIPSKDGNIMVLDSVFANHSQLMEQYLVSDDLMQIKGFGADLANENAYYSMVMPTDAVWADGQAKLAPHYRYSSKYEDKIKGDEGASGSAIAMIVSNPDSLSVLSIGADILVPLLGKTNYEQEVKLSNGTACTAFEWPVPASEYKPDVEVEIEDESVFYNIIQGRGRNYKVGSNSGRYTFSNDFYKDITSVYGRVSNNNFYHLAQYSASAGPKVEIKLKGNSPTAYVPEAEVMSGKYDIQIVFVPYWYLQIALAYKIEDMFYNLVTDTLVNDTIVDGIAFTDTTYVVRTWDGINTEYIDSIGKLYQYSYKVSLTSNNGTADKTQVLLSKGTYTGQRVDTLTVAEDFEFPVSYKNVHCSYPTLTLEWVKPSKAPEGEAYVYDLIVDKIILRSKEDGSETVVTP